MCFTSRANHVEDVGSLETDAFIQALRRFICTRGAVKEIWSDNGTNFTGGEREIKLAIQDLDHRIIQRSLNEKDVEWQCQPLVKWHFQPPTASHMSGVWERLIRSVRNAMKAIFGHPHAFVTRETLRTVFGEVVGILNSRPLCPSSDDPSDREPIAPSHLLQQRQGMSLPLGAFQNEDLHSHKQWRKGQLLSNHFWTRWQREYLPLLQERKKWILKRRNLAVNDLVRPRCDGECPTWPLAPRPSHKSISWPGWLGSYGRGQDQELNPAAPHFKVVPFRRVKVTRNIRSHFRHLNIELFLEP